MANENIEGNVVISDESMRVSQLLGARARAAPQKSTPVNEIPLLDFVHPSTCSHGNRIQRPVWSDVVNADSIADNYL